MAYEIDRFLKIELAKGQSAFLWGARKTGKTTLLRRLFQRSAVFDFLQTDLYLDCLKKPSLFRELVLALSAEERLHPILVDEVQKVPAVLDEIHWLMENKGLSFMLCGSSARKLKRGHANMLGGRAWRFELFPFVSAEIADVDLLRALNQGLIPSHYLAEPQSARRFLTAYTQDYLKQEILDEGLVRNMPAFSRFFDAVGFSHGEMINYANIARDCGIDAKTVKEYYQILVDTLLGVMVEPFARKQGRQVITKTPKFYLFDVGVANAVCGRTIAQARGAEFGKAFEHFIFMELNAYRSYSEKQFRINYWRTKTGAEVDFVLGEGELAIEVKSGGYVDSGELSSLRAFIEEYAPKRAIVVGTEQRARKVGAVEILPWREFLKQLWQGILWAS